MIIPFLAAGLVLLAAFVLHTITGTKEYLAIKPSEEKSFVRWAMGAGAFQMVTIDLLLTGIFALMLGLELIDYNYYLALFITLLYAGYLTVWLTMLALLRIKGPQHKYLGQWVIFLVVMALMAYGIFMQ